MKHNKVNNMNLICLGYVYRDIIILVNHFKNNLTPTRPWERVNNIINCSSEHFIHHTLTNLSFIFNFATRYDIAIYKIMGKGQNKQNLAHLVYCIACVVNSNLFLTSSSSTRFMLVSITFYPCIY